MLPAVRGRFRESPVLAYQLSFFFMLFCSQWIDSSLMVLADNDAVSLVFAMSDAMCLACVCLLW